MGASFKFAGSGRNDVPIGAAVRQQAALAGALQALRLQPRFSPSPKPRFLLTPPPALPTMPPPLTPPCVADSPMHRRPHRQQRALDDEQFGPARRDGAVYTGRAARRSAIPGLLG